MQRDTQYARECTYIYVHVYAMFKQKMGFFTNPFRKVLICTILNELYSNKH